MSDILVEPEDPNDTVVELITGAELTKRSGAAYGQVEHWSTNHVLPYTLVNGSSRMYEATLVPKVALLTRVVRQIATVASIDFHKKLMAEYDAGYTELENGLSLFWEVG